MISLHTLIALDRPILSLDFETTGVHTHIDRIVSMGVCKLYPDGEYKEWETLINPTIPIPKEASDVHHITNEMVKDSPTFRQVHLKIAKAMEGCDICGYNVGNFDVKILSAEFGRCNYTWEVPRIVDAFRIYQRVSPRNLTAAVRDYLSETLEGAHGALPDARASLRVLAAQLEKHPELPRSVQGLHDMFFTLPRDSGSLDPDGKIVWKDKKACINFGKKHPGKSLQEIRALDPGFLEWMAGPKGDFSPVVKKIVTDALAGIFPAQP